MKNDHEIGRVISIDTAQITVELNGDIKAFIRSTYEGTLEVGKINSYIIIPAGAIHVVAMVTKVFLTEESEISTDKTMITLPTSRRLMRATMIGTISDNEFKQGISLFPVLDSPVLVCSKSELDIIFGANGRGNEKPIGSDDPGYCIPVGKSSVFPEYEVKIHPDKFFGKHAAILGSTGSGKSCTIATILQSVLEDPKVKQSRIIILDTNGEYKSAFESETKETIGGNTNALHIPSDQSHVDHLTIPYWFMNSDDFSRLFKAAPGVQRPVLMKALSYSRGEKHSKESWRQLRDELITDLNRISAFKSGSEKSDAKYISQICDGMLTYLNHSDTESSLNKLIQNYPNLDKDGKTLIKCFDAIMAEAKRGIKNEGSQYESWAVIDINKRRKISTCISWALNILSNSVTSAGEVVSNNTDSPSHFYKYSFRHRHLESAMSHDESRSNRTKESCSTMLMRIHRLIEDSRFKFLFGEANKEWSHVKHSLATFLRDILGLPSSTSADKTLSNTEELAPNELPFYDRQRNGSEGARVTIIDLSLLASEVLENVTALIGRIIHEFLQHLSDPSSGIERGDFPVVLVLEEAQNYIRQTNLVDEESISKVVFERIAREGRKFGLGLVLASQRPSELSKTVLSQCNSFIVHRLQNPEDLRYFREIVPGIYGQMLEQLPALAQRNTLILGECVKAPVQTLMRRVNPAPTSKDPKFYKSWTSESIIPDVEAVCAKWEENIEIKNEQIRPVDEE